jgi:hypothetical protein
MSKLPVLVLIAAVTSAAGVLPAFAQAFDPDAGSGNIVPFSAGPPALLEPSIVAQPRIAARPRHNSSAAARQSGLHAFAMVPGNSGGGSVGFSTYDPGLTGGGSLGYNQNLANY